MAGKGRIKIPISKLHEDSVVVLRPLVVHADPGQEPLVGCPEIRQFMEVEADTLKAIRAIQHTRTLREANARLLAQTGEEFDLVELVTYMAKRGFVKSFDGFEIPDLFPNARKRHKLLHALKPRQVAWVKHPLTWIACGIIIALWVGTIALDHDLRPGVHKVFWTRDPLVVLLTSFSVSLLLTYGHELAHFFMARAYAIESTVNITNRFYMAIMTTDVTNAWTLPRGPRIKIFMAGVLFNATLAAICGLVAAGIHWGMLPLDPWVMRLCLFLQTLNFFPITFQFFLFMRTDFYYVISTLMGERNYSVDSSAYLKFRLARVWRALSGAPRGVCVSCAKAVQAEDPFCLRCGTRQPARDPNKYSFSPGKSVRLLVFGLVMAFGRVWMYFNFFTLGWRMQVMFVSNGVLMLGAAIATHSLGRVLEAQVLLFFLAVQAAFILYFMSSGIFALLAGAAKRLAPKRPTRQVEELSWSVAR